MRTLIFFFTIFSFGVLACIPVLPGGAVLHYFPDPTFKTLDSVTEHTGHLEAKVTINEKGKIVAIHTIDVYPTYLPKEPVIESLEKAVFIMLHARTIENGEITLPFNIIANEKPKVEFSGIDINEI